MNDLEEFWPALRAQAGEYADDGSKIGIADARWFVLSLYRKAKIERPDEDALEHFASELVRFTDEALDRRSRLRWRPSV